MGPPARTSGGWAGITSTGIRTSFSGGPAGRGASRLRGPPWPLDPELIVLDEPTSGSSTSSGWGQAQKF